MATRQAIFCDVFGTTKKVEHYTVRVTGANGVDVYDAKCDLSSRGLDRLKRFIERGRHPSGWTPEPPTTGVKVSQPVQDAKASPKK